MIPPDKEAGLAYWERGHFERFYIVSTCFVCSYHSSFSYMEQNPTQAYPGKGGWLNTKNLRTQSTAQENWSCEQKASRTQAALLGTTEANHSPPSTWVFPALGFLASVSSCNPDGRTSTSAPKPSDNFLCLNDQILRRHSSSFFQARAQDLGFK